MQPLSQNRTISIAIALATMSLGRHLHEYRDRHGREGIIVPVCDVA